ncbi:unnamed protein product [Spirodela intermedia]|uniref:Uncharacterized protein n=1 Tax=Spirodela intermedia TaxID=51605 RepID=A0A7I8JYX0_SPIIN|nr:unnamed protein product [Spirodela intermedia]
MHQNPEHLGGLSCSVHCLEGSPWTKTTWAISRSSREVQRSMKWVVELSPAAITRRSGKTATLRLSGGSAVTRQRGAGWRWGVCQGASSSSSCSNLLIYLRSLEINEMNR